MTCSATFHAIHGPHVAFPYLKLVVAYGSRCWLVPMPCSKESSKTTRMVQAWGFQLKAPLLMVNLATKFNQKILPMGLFKREFQLQLRILEAYVIGDHFRIIILNMITPFVSGINDGNHFFVMNRSPCCNLYKNYLIQMQLGSDPISNCTISHIKCMRMDFKWFSQITYLKNQLWTNKLFEVLESKWG